MSSHFDLILLAALAGFLIFRLWKVLGKHNDSTERHSSNNTRHLHVVPRFPNDKIAKDKPPQDSHNFSESLRKLEKLDPRFSEGSFLEGAQIAYKQMFTANQRGDLGEANTLCSSKIKQIFQDQIETLKAKKWTSHNELLRILSAHITNIQLDRKTAKIKVTFKTEQIFEIRDRKNKLVKGDPDQIEINQEIWTFSRSIVSKDPNWQLVDIIT